jgi:hypothetical protein
MSLKAAAGLPWRTLSTIEVEVTVRARLTSLTRVSNHKSLPRADSPNALTSITRSSLSTSAGAYPRLVRQAQVDYQPTADRAQRNGTLDITLPELSHRSSVRYLVR